jgi:hypothetical protein
MSLKLITFKTNHTILGDVTEERDFVYIKQSGLYVGQNVGPRVVDQKTNPCYKNTCNLFYTETPEFCSNNS